MENTTLSTAQNLLNDMLLFDAKTLLKFAKLQIEEIAASLCDQTLRNFSRFFKSQAGITPKEHLNIN